MGQQWIFTIGMALKSRHRPVVSGREELLSCEGLVVEDFTSDGAVRVHGEVWRAHSRQPLRKDQPVQIIGREGLVLEVTPTDKETSL